MFFLCQRIVAAKKRSSRLFIEVLELLYAILE